MDISTVLKHNPKIIQLFNDYCPDLNFENLEEDLIKDMVESIIGKSLKDFSQKPTEHFIQMKDKLIEDNYDMADKHIPEMLFPSNLIYLNGKINNIPVKILFDTGASSNCIFKSKIIEAGLDYIVDKNDKVKIQGINSNKETYGKIWYTEIELKLNFEENENISSIVGLNLMVIDDDKSDKNENTFDVILGLNFMKSYRTNIDFMTNTITLNNKIKIKFN